MENDNLERITSEQLQRELEISDALNRVIRQGDVAKLCAFMEEHHLTQSNIGFRFHMGQGNSLPKRHWEMTNFLRQCEQAYFRMGIDRELGRVISQGSVESIKFYMNRYGVTEADVWRVAHANNLIGGLSEEHQEMREFVNSCETAAISEQAKPKPIYLGPAR